MEKKTKRNYRKCSEPMMKGASIGLLILLSIQLISVKETNGCVLLVTGGTCLAGLEAAELAVGEQLRAQGLEPLVRTIQTFCRGILNLSPEYLLIRAVEPPLRELLDLIDDVPLDTPQGFSQLRDRLESVVRAIG